MSDLLRDSARCGYTSTVMSLIDEGHDPNDQDDSGHSAVHYAAAYHCPEVLDLLVDVGGDPDLPDIYGFTARQYAGRLGYEITMYP